MHGVPGHANNNGASPYQSSGGPARSYTTPDFPNPFPPQPYSPQPQQSYQPQPQQSYQPQEYQPQPQQRPQAQPTQAYPGQNYQPQAPVQGRQASLPASAPSVQAYQPEPGPSRSFPDAGFPERIFPGDAHPGGGFGEQGFADTNYADANFPEASFPDASFPDASFEDASFPEGQAEQNFGHSSHDTFSEHGPHPLDDADAPYGTDSGADSFADPSGHDYQQSPRPLPSHHALQAFDAGYDQPPQIPLGRTPQYAHEGAAQGFYEGDQGDADFLDESQFMSPGDAEAKPARKFSLKSRSIYMVGSALLGAVALGGALAFAYKQSGGAMGGGEPPVVQADSRPVKEPPQQPGGKDTPHKNKLIYDRLQNGDQPEAERIVPRQEDLAMPAMPGTAPGAAPMQPPAVATVDDPNAADGGPRRVKTLIVRPDGSVMPPPQAPAAAQQAAPAPAPQQQMAAADPGMPAMPMPQAAPAPAPAPVAQAAPPPAPVADPAPVAAIPPKPKPAPEAAPAKPSQYVVQVGSKQNQTDALATFADMQQKYPTLLASYRPMVQKADLGAKGVWYRLRIGPIVDKSAASKLCSQLKSQGHPDCLVMAAQ